MSPPSSAQRSFPVSWEELHRHGRALAWRLLELGPFRGLVAVTRGGLVPAAVVARELEIRLIDTLCIASYDERAQGELQVLKGVAGDGEGLLVIDDLVDTGRTATMIRKLLPKAHFATIYAKPAGRPLVDTFITEVSQDTWILFPWDIEPQFVPPIRGYRAMSDSPAVPSDALATRPRVALAPGRHKRAEHGHPWIYSNELVLDEAAKALTPGTLVTALTADGRQLGVGSFNLHPLVSLRLYDRDPGRAIDGAFFQARLRRALELRTRLFDGPFYRLVHAEADGLPGVIVDRYGDAVVCQFNTAGAARLEQTCLEAIDAVLKPARIVLRNDSPARQTEGLEPEVRVVKGRFDGPVTVEENGCRYLADLGGGQKTGWFFDQRANRRFVAALAASGRMLDVYSFTGGFGLLAALAGASHVRLLDRSQASLDLAMAAAHQNGVADRVVAQAGEAFETLAALAAGRERFETVVLDPPSFVKSRKDLGPGSRAYRKLARLGASVTARRGVLLAASCSHNMTLDAFGEAVALGVAEAGRSARIIHTGFASPDHPVHPALPESAYLKALVLVLD